MGLYYSAHKANFSELLGDSNPLGINEDSFYEWLDETAYSIKLGRIIHVIEPLEYALEFLDDSVKRKILPFFINTFWENYFADDYHDLIDFNRYTPAVFDDFGALGTELYYRSYSCGTIRKIVEDFKTIIDLNEIRSAFNLSQEYNNDQGESEEEFQKKRDERFQDFNNELNNIIRLYEECGTENKDLFIDFG